MCHVKKRPSPNLTVGLVPLLFVLLTLIHACRGQSEAIGPSQPIVTFVGDDVILPCYLNPAMNAFDLTVEWSRSDLDPRFVLVWRDNVELLNKHQSYKGRTSLFIDELKRGNVSLKLSRVKLSDGGTYKCFVPQVAETTVDLIVAAPSSPVIQHKNNSGEVVLQCESTGWYPEPEVSWLDAEGNLLSAGPTETVRGPDDLYNVSSRVTVEKRHSNNFTCRVQQRNINQTRETQIHVPDDFFIIPAAPETPGNLNTTAVWVPVVVIILLLIIFPAVIFVVWKKKLIKCKNKRKSYEDGTDQEDEEKIKFINNLDNSHVKVEMEREGENSPLLAKQREKNDEDNRENIRENSIQFVTERETEPETHQDQFVTKPELLKDVNRSGDERRDPPVSSVIETLISTEPEPHPGQDMMGRQVQNDLDKREEEERKKLQDDSGLVSLGVDGQQPQDTSLGKEDTDLREGQKKTQSSTYQTDQQLQKPKDKSDEDKMKDVAEPTGQMQEEENQTERRQTEEERQKEEKNKIQTKKKEQKEKDKTAANAKNRTDKHHVQEDKNQSGITAMKEKKLEETNKEKVENEEKGESQRGALVQKPNTRLSPQKINQCVLENNKQEDIKRPEVRKDQEDRRTDQKPVLDFGLNGQNQEQKKYGEQSNTETGKVENERKLQSQRNKHDEQIETQKEKSLEKPENHKRERIEDHSDINTMKERRTENKEKMNETLKESNEEKVENKKVQQETLMEKQNQAISPQSHHHLLEDNKQESKTVEDRKEKYQEDDRTLETQSKKQYPEMENKVPSISGNITETEVNMQPETAGKENQALQKPESQEGPQGEMLETNLKLNTKEPKRKINGGEELQLRQVKSVQAEQKPEINTLESPEGTTVKPRESRKYLRGRKAKCQKEEEPMEIDTSQSNVKKTQKRKHQQEEEELHVELQKTHKQRKGLDEDVEMMETESNTNIHSGQTQMCQEDQQEEKMIVH